MRTRELLQEALMTLLKSQPYDTLTVQAIADLAGTGRTTFYLHFESKEDLYRSAHQAEVAKLAGMPLTRDELLADNPPDRMEAVYAYHWASRDLLRMLYFAKDAEVIRRRMHDQLTEQTAAHLQAVFSDMSFVLPVDWVASALIVAEMGLMQWWFEKHAAYTPRQMAAYFHRMRRGLLREAIASLPIEAEEK